MLIVANLAHVHLAHVGNSYAILHEGSCRGSSEIMVERQDGHLVPKSRQFDRQGKKTAVGAGTFQTLSH